MEWSPLSEIERHLERWQAAGLLTAETAGNIRAFESTQRPDPGREGEAGPSVIEVLLYLGIVVASAGAFFLITQNWGELTSWARVLVLAVPAALVLALGAMLRSFGEPALQRAGQLSWFVSAALVPGTVAVALAEYGPDSSGGNRDEFTSLMIVAVSAVAVALALWAFEPSHPQLVAAGASLVFLAQTIGSYPDDFSLVIAGGLLLAYGAIGLALTERGLIQPRASARVIFAAMALAGPYQAGFGPLAFELLTFVVAAGVIALGVWRRSFLLVMAGTTAVFVALVTFVFEHFGDELGAPLALLLCGALLIVGVVLLAVARGALKKRRGS